MIGTKRSAADCYSVTTAEEKKAKILQTKILQAKIQIPKNFEGFGYDPEEHDGMLLPECLVMIPPPHVVSEYKKSRGKKMYMWNLDSRFHFLINKSSVDKLNEWFDLCAYYLSRDKSTNDSENTSLRKQATYLRKGIQAFHTYWTTNYPDEIYHFRNNTRSNFLFEDTPSCAKKPSCLESEPGLRRNRCSKCTLQNCARMFTVWDYFPPLPRGTVLYQTHSVRFNHNFSKGPTVGDCGQFKYPINAAYSPTTALLSTKHINRENYLNIFITKHGSIRAAPSQLMYHEEGVENNIFNTWYEDEVTIQPYYQYKVLGVYEHTFMITERFINCCKANNHFKSMAPNDGSHKGQNFHIVVLELF
ncbi:MAG: hypothetical protein ACTSUE_25280 [Promethearchaeota archaeon]